MSSNSSQNCCSSPDGSRSYPSVPNNQFATGLGPPISSPSASATSGRNNLNNANRSTVPETKKDNKYWERRRRNNEAARRSREKRRQNDLVLDQRIGEVTIRNRELEQEILQLRFQLNSLTKDCGTAVTNVGTTKSSISKSNQSTFVNCNNVKSPSSSSSNNCANNNVVLPIFTTMDHDKQASLLLLTSPTINSSANEELNASSMSITNSNVSPPINNNSTNNNNNKCVNNPTNILTLSSIPLLSNLLTAAQFTTSISSKLESIPLSSASVSTVAISETVCSTSSITNSSNSITNSSAGNVISSSLSNQTSNLTGLVPNQIVSSTPFYNKNTNTTKEIECEINSISNGNIRKRKRKYDNQDILDLRIKPEKMANIFNENESETPVYNEGSQCVIGSNETVSKFNNSFLTGITTKLSRNSNSPHSHISSNSSDSSESTFVPVSPSPTSSALSFTPSKLCNPQISNETEASPTTNHTILPKQSNSLTNGNVDDSDNIKQIHLSNNSKNQSNQEDISDKTKCLIKERRCRRIKRNQYPTNLSRTKWSYPSNMTQLLHHQIRSTLTKHKQEINLSLDNLKQQMGDMKSLLLQIMQPTPPSTSTTTTNDDNNNNSNINDNTINVDNNYGNHSFK